MSEQRQTTPRIQRLTPKIMAMRPTNNTPDCPYCGKAMQVTPERYYCGPCRYMAMEIVIGVANQ